MAVPKLFYMRRWSITCSIYPQIPISSLVKRSHTHETNLWVCQHTEFQIFWLHVYQARVCHEGSFLVMLDEFDLCGLTYSALENE